MELISADQSVYRGVTSRSKLGREETCLKMGQLAWNWCLKANKFFKIMTF